MQGDPNQSQEILSTNKHYYADVFLVVGFKYIEKSLDEYSSSLLQRLLDVKVLFLPPRTGVSTASINK